MRLLLLLLDVPEITHCSFCTRIPETLIRSFSLSLSLSLFRIDLPLLVLKTNLRNIIFNSLHDHVVITKRSYHESSIRSSLGSPFIHKLVPDIAIYICAEKGR